MKMGKDVENCSKRERLVSYSSSTSNSETSSENSSGSSDETPQPLRNRDDGNNVQMPSRTPPPAGTDQVEMRSRNETATTEPRLLHLHHPFQSTPSFSSYMMGMNSMPVVPMGWNSAAAYFHMIQIQQANALLQMELMQRIQYEQLRDIQMRMRNFTQRITTTTTTACSNGTTTSVEQVLEISSAEGSANSMHPSADGTKPLKKRVGH